MPGQAKGQFDIDQCVLFTFYEADNYMNTFGQKKQCNHEIIHLKLVLLSEISVFIMHPYIRSYFHVIAAGFISDL